MSDKLKLSPSIAGITLLALGNGTHMYTLHILVHYSAIYIDTKCVPAVSVNFCFHIMPSQIKVHISSLATTLIPIGYIAL